MAVTIGLIGEGVTDQTVIRQILHGSTGDDNLLTAPLQPGARKAQGGWPRVLKYCGSQRFRQAFTAPEFVAVVQIDTDWLLRDDNAARHGIPDAHTLPAAELVAAVRHLLIREMTVEVYERHSTRIMFAISVHQIECWLLGIYYDEDVASQTENCEDLLHEKAAKRGVKSREKKTADFQTMCKAFEQKANLEKHSIHNASFRIFLDELRTKLAVQQAL